MFIGPAYIFQLRIQIQTKYLLEMNGALLPILSYPINLLTKSLLKQLHFQNNY